MAAELRVTPCASGLIRCEVDHLIRSIEDEMTLVGSDLIIPELLRDTLASNCVEEIKRILRVECGIEWEY